MGNGFTGTDMVHMLSISQATLHGQLKDFNLEISHSFSTIDNDTSSSETQGRSVGSGEKAERTFSLRTKEPLGTDSHRTISKNSSRCRLLIGHKKCFVLLCPIDEQISMSSFRSFVHDGYCLDRGLSNLCTKEMHAVRNFQFDIKSPSDPTRLLCQMQANSSEPYQSSWKEWILLLLMSFTKSEIRHFHG